MAGEGDFIALMRGLAGTEAARGLVDDVALLRGRDDLILTTDTLVESLHYLPDDPAESIGWKLAAVNLSDLAAKGARPAGCLVNYMLSGDPAWDAAFARGLGAALSAFGMPLLGGDTVGRPQGAPLVLSLTAIGAVAGSVPSRAGAQVGDLLYVTGPVGDAGAGLKLLQAGEVEPEELVAAYRQPQPQLALGQAVAPHAHASMDISDGLLIDAQRMAEASGVHLAIEHVPLSPDYELLHGDDVAARMAAATAGDDYQLLFAMPPAAVARLPKELICIGKVEQGQGLSLTLDGERQSLPGRLGWEHG